MLGRFTNYSALWGFQKLAFELNFDEQNLVALVAPPSRLPGDGVSSGRPLVLRISTVAIGSTCSLSGEILFSFGFCDFVVLLLT